MKKIFIILAVLLLLGGGGCYYVFFIQPDQYGRGFTAAFKLVDEKSRELQNQIQSQQTPADALSNIQKQKELFEFMRKELSNLTPPFYGEYRQFHKDFLFMLDTMSAVSAKLGELALFQAKIQDLKLTLEFGGLQKVDLNTVTIGQIIPILEEHVAKAKSLAQELFVRDSPVPIEKPSWGEVKTAWPETEQGLNTVLAWYKSLDQKIIAMRVGPETMDAERMEALLKVEQFKKLLEEFLQARPPDSFSISAGPSAQTLGISEEEFEALNDRVSATIEKIKEQYGE